MLHLYCDVSMDIPICSVGYVLQRAHRGERELVETGVRALNTEAHPRDIDWDSMRGEYFAAIVGVRAALPYTDEPIMVASDCEDVVGWIRRGDDPFEEYFQHALHSFLERFPNYDVRHVYRDNNEEAHDLARVGLQACRAAERVGGEQIEVTTT
jgi:hypothetical protein